MPTSDTIQTVTDTLSAGVQVVNDTLPTSTQTLADSVSLYAPVWPTMLWGDTLVPPASLFDLLHSHGQPLPYNLMRDPLAVALLLGVFVALLLVFATCRNYMSDMLRRFFVPTNNMTPVKELRTPAQIWSPLSASLALCVGAGLLLTAHLSQHFDLLSGFYSPRLVMGCSIGLFVAYYSLRRLLYVFVNWIFFERSDRRQWSAGYAFLTVLEGLLLLPILMCALNGRWDFGFTLIVVVVSLGILRFLLLYYSFRIFFPKIYGVLHLFSYLCTLELIPLFFLWKTAVILSQHLIVK